MKIMLNAHHLLLIAIGIISFLLTKLENVAKDHRPNRRRYWIYNRNATVDHLHHVITVLDRLGYENHSEWDLLWSHVHPFVTLQTQLRSLKPHQKVNKFPGTGWVTNKVDLATSGLKYIPAAFRLPEDRDRFLAYAKKNPQVRFVQKDNEHRRIKIVNVWEMDPLAKGVFVQEFVDRPFVIDGHKFDIGIYVVLTSVDPLRLYIYNGDALLRFCPEKYYPFDSSNIDKYIIGDDYLPIWDVPDLKYTFDVLKFSMKESLNSYVRSRGKNPGIIWKQIEDSIRTVFLHNEHKIVKASSGYRSRHNFFEMMRFDFIIDQDLNVYLMEANMSPNLSSSHFPRNKLLFEQIIFNLFGLVGVADRISHSEDFEMIVADKNVGVFPTECASSLCKNNCAPSICQLCHTCLTAETRNHLYGAYVEYTNRGDYKRIFPPPMSRQFTIDSLDVEQYSPENRIHTQWFLGKCMLDMAWCN